MARPKKQGIDYFPYDADLDQDDKLGMIIGEFGFKGEQAYTKLLCWIYKNEGYYTGWKEDVQLRFMRRYSYCGFSLSFVINEVVPRCIKWGLFDKAVFESFQILTSSRIQETWLDATRQRTGRVYIPKYWLIKVNHALQPEETELIPEVIDKVNESKLNESKEVLAVATQPPDIDKTEKRKTVSRFVPPTLDEAKAFFVKTIGNPRKPGHWPADKCENEAGKYFNHYTANGWKQGRGKPIVDWQAACRIWITNEREGAFSAPTYQAKNSPPPVQKPQLSNIEKEVNFLYDMYCERPEKWKDQLINVEVTHYNHIKSAGLISFTNEKIDEIKKEVNNYMNDQEMKIDDTSMLKYMKKFGTIYFFKDYSKQGKERVF